MPLNEPQAEKASLDYLYGQIQVVIFEVDFKSIPLTYCLGS